MSNDRSAYMIVTPRSFVIIASKYELHAYLWTKEIEARCGKYHVQQRGVPVYYGLHFDDGLQDEVALPVGDLLQLSSVGLIQLVQCHSGVTGKLEMELSKELKKFFDVDSNAYANALRHIQYVMVPLANRTPIEAAHEGAFARYSIRQEREKRGEFWDTLLKP